MYACLDGEFETERTCLRCHKRKEIESNVRRDGRSNEGDHLSSRGTVSTLLSLRAVGTGGEARETGEAALDRRGEAV
jgi:hypothetical protein